MGNWLITIEGVGAHHNGRLEVDADLQAAEFARKLRSIGQSLTRAEFSRVNGEGETVADNLLRSDDAPAAVTPSSADAPPAT